MTNQNSFAGDITPLSESMLQRLYKSKTYMRNEEWDVIWYLGGRNNVAIGERAGRFYLLPADYLLPAADRQTVVTDILPFELIQGTHAYTSQAPVLIETVADLIRAYPEMTHSDRQAQHLPGKGSASARKLC